MHNIDVLCAGATSYDLVFSVKQHPGPDEKTIAESLISCGGGPAANAAVTVSRLGLKAAFCGYLGNDIFGQLHLQELKTAGVNTEWIVSADRATPVSTILVKPGGERSLINYRQAKPLNSNQFDFEAINPKVILIDGHEPDISSALLKLAYRKNIPTILDAGSVNPGTEKLCMKVDYLVCSEMFAQEITGKKNMEVAIEKLYMRCKNVIITRGKNGLLWKTEKGQGLLDSYTVNAVDTTGAGDVFHGTFACCIALKKEWHYTLMYSSAAAALSCTKLGARPSTPTHKEVFNFLEIHK